jgi:hypothetical protein
VFHAPYLSANTKSGEPSTNIEPTNTEVDLGHTSHANVHTEDLEEHDTSASLSNFLQDLRGLQIQVDSAVSSPSQSAATLPNSVRQAIGLDHDPQLDPNNTPFTHIWTSPSSSGTIDTDPSVTQDETRVLDPNIDLLNNNPSPQPTTSIPTERTSIQEREPVEAKPVRCSYYGIVFDRTCDLK